MWIGSKERKNIVIFPEKVVILEADANIKTASTNNMHDFLNEYKDFDVIAKQLLSHDECCKLFTCDFSVVFREGQLMVPDEQATQVESQGQGS